MSCFRWWLTDYKILPAAAEYANRRHTIHPHRPLPSSCRRTCALQQHGYPAEVLDKTKDQGNNNFFMALYFWALFRQSSAYALTHTHDVSPLRSVGHPTRGYTDNSCLGVVGSLRKKIEYKSPEPRDTHPSPPAPAAVAVPLGSPLATSPSITFSFLSLEAQRPISRVVFFFCRV